MTDFIFVRKEPEWAQNSQPAAAAQATTTRTADSNGGHHICTSITVGVASGGTVSGIRLVRLRDGTSGNGDILWGVKINIPVDSSREVTLGGLSIKGSRNTAMTLEFVGNASATNEETVAMTGYTT